MTHLVILWEWGLVKQKVSLPTSILLPSYRFHQRYRQSRYIDVDSRSPCICNTCPTRCTSASLCCQWIADVADATNSLHSLRTKLGEAWVRSNALNFLLLFLLPLATSAFLPQSLLFIVLFFPPVSWSSQLFRQDSRSRSAATKLMVTADTIYNRGGLSVVDYKLFTVMEKL